MIFFLMRFEIIVKASLSGNTLSLYQKSGTCATPQSDFDQKCEKSIIILQLLNKNLVDMIFLLLFTPCRIFDIIIIYNKYVDLHMGDEGFI